MERTLLLAALLSAVGYSFAQNTRDSVIQSEIGNYYKLALQYKDGRDGIPIDFGKAYDYFLKAAQLGDAQSVYAVAYMRYKGLGCMQSYDTAAVLFAKGAAGNRDNSLYFYGLCWRNGYGVARNEDSARYYLQKSADLGYKQAMMELQTSAAENSNDSAAEILLRQISNAAVPDGKVLNQFNKIQPHLPPGEIIAGKYAGWLIQYDWSGVHMVATKKLQLDIAASHGEISGEWIEQDADTAKIRARIVSDSLVFEQTKYARKDHYSLKKSIGYNFQVARLDIVQFGDSVFLAGNIEMFSPLRGEPSKPIFVVLSRGGLRNMDSAAFNGLEVNAYPNPFVDLLNVQFHLPKAGNVRVRMYDMKGAMLYDREAGVLEEGSYSLPLYDLRLAEGLYILNLSYDNESRSIKIMKR
jgi:TPR repeat protein